MLYDDAKFDTIDREDIEMLRENLICAALTLPYEDKLELLGFIKRSCRCNPL